MTRLREIALYAVVAALAVGASAIGTRLLIDLVIWPQVKAGIDQGLADWGPKRVIDLGMRDAMAPPTHEVEFSDGLRHIAFVDRLDAGPGIAAWVLKFPDGGVVEIR